MNFAYQFVVQGDAGTLGFRWVSLVERFKLFMLADSLTRTTNEPKAKASFLLMMGSQGYENYKTLKKSNDSDTLDKVVSFMTKHLVVERSEFTEICILRKSATTNESRNIAWDWGSSQIITANSQILTKRYWASWL